MKMITKGDRVIVLDSKSLTPRLRPHIGKRGRVSSIGLSLYAVILDERRLGAVQRLPLYRKEVRPLTPLERLAEVAE